MSNELTSLYSTRKNTFESTSRNVQEKENLTSWSRVGLMALTLLMAWFAFSYLWLWLFVIVFLLLYTWLVTRHERIKRELKLLQSLTLINANEIKSQQGDHTSFANGAEFIDSHHPYSFDLDFFGEGSIFQRINRTASETGKERLSAMLTNPLQSIGAILERQAAIEELKGKLEFRQRFQAVGMGALEKKEDQRKILEWLSLPAMIYGNKSFRLALIIVPLLALAGLLFWIFFGMSVPFIAIALIQLAVIGRYAKRVTLLQDYIGNKRYLLEKFAEHFDLLNGEDFKTDITKKLNRDGQEAKTQLSSLASRSRALDLRLNLFTMLFLNSTVLYDLQCVYRLEAWREKNRSRLEKWLDAIAEADALNSLATFAFNNPQFVKPEITTEDALVAATLGHPLIDESKRVTNDVAFGKQSAIWVVTGANMAGKSTFLRTVGVNAVLALIGSVVCAKKFTCPIVSVVSGMRNTDSINENQSYFFAELLRLHNIIVKLSRGEKLLILLDEILRGTNSADKLTGSQELIKQLTNHRCLAMIATHDVALGEMEKQFQQVKNFHFETFINGDELSFDYKLKPGVSTGKNATFLMRKMGIIPPQ